MQLIKTELTAASWWYGALCVYKVGSSARRAMLLCWHHDVPVPIWPHMTPSPRPTFQRCLQSARPPPNPVSVRIHGNLTRRSDVEHLVRRGAWRAHRETVAWKYCRVRCDICICVSPWSLWHVTVVIMTHVTAVIMTCHYCHYDTWHYSILWHMPYGHYMTHDTLVIMSHVTVVIMAHVTAVIMTHVTAGIMTHVTVVIMTHVIAVIMTHVTAVIMTHVTVVIDTCHCSHYDTCHCSHYDVSLLSLYDTWHCSIYDTCHMVIIWHMTLVFMTHVIWSLYDTCHSVNTCCHHNSLHLYTPQPSPWPQHTFHSTHPLVAVPRPYVNSTAHSPSPSIQKPFSFPQHFLLFTSSSFSPFIPRPTQIHS